MCNTFRCIFSSDREQGLVLPPCYELHLPRDLRSFNYPPTLPDYHFRNFQRCLMWRMAVDWKLQHHIMKYDRPQRVAWSTFEEDCRLLSSYMLGKRTTQKLATQELEQRLSICFFKPADSIGISKNLLQLFIFSIRQAEQYPRKRITCRRNAMMLVRLVLDSCILIDLMAPGTVFAKKLKANCAQLYKENFPWLLDPARISINESVKARATDIYDEHASRGRWKETELLLRECMRPCAALMDPNLTPSTMCEVNMSYLEPDADVGLQPGFAVRPWREHRNLLPAAIVCGPVEWENTDQSVATASPEASPGNQESSKQACKQPKRRRHRNARRFLSL